MQTDIKETVDEIQAAYFARINDVARTLGAVNGGARGVSLEELVWIGLPPGVMRRTFVCCHGKRLGVVEIAHLGHPISKFIVRGYPYSLLAAPNAPTPDIPGE